MSVQASHRAEDRLMEDIQGALKGRNYPVDVPGTHTLRELLMLSSVDMETSNSTSITALYTIDASPAETLDSFERLLSFTREKDHTHKGEVSQILFPVFVHFYLDLLSSSHTDTALTLFSRYKDSLGGGHSSELKELSELKSRDHLNSSPLVAKFRKLKFSLRMSSTAFHLLMQFLQVCHTPVLFNTIEQYITLEVYGSAPLTVDMKQDLKKSLSPSFTKPRLPQLAPEDLARNKLRRASNSGRFSGTLEPSKPRPLPSPKSVAVPTTATPPAQLAEFRERLNVAAAASQLMPTLPSVSLHTISSDHLHAHCAAFNSQKSLFCFGFSDSSLRLWAELPLATDHMTSHDPSSTNRPEVTNVDQSLPKSHIPPLLGHRGAVYDACFNDRGKFLLSSSEDCTVRLWDVDKRSCVVCYHGHQYPVWNVTFSPVDIYFVTCSHDTTARLWTCELAYPVRIFAGHTAGVNVAQFHPNGKYMATGSSDHTCRLWDIHSGQCVRLLTGRKGSVQSIVFLPNGKHMLTSGEDGIVCVWDLGSGSVVREFKGHQGPLRAMCCSSDGSLLATGGSDHTVRLWHLNSNNDSSAGSSVLSQVSVADCRILSLHFTHRNCLKALASRVK